MKTQPWITILAGVVLLSGVVGPAWCQPKCAPGVIYRCPRPAVVEKWCEPCDACNQKSCGKNESTCEVKIVQKSVMCPPRILVTAGEPRKLALSHGCFKRIQPCESAKSNAGCGSAKYGCCLGDCRHETIFGTETIFGATSQRGCQACPDGCSGLSGSNVLAGVFSQLDASLHKVFAGPRTVCGGSKGKDRCGSGGKSKGCQDAWDAPLLEGQPLDPQSQENPFRDDAVESDADQPAPLPPAPLPPAAAAATRLRADESPSLPAFAHVSDRISTPATSLARTDARTVEHLPPNAPSITERSGPSTLRRPIARLTTFQLE